MSHRFNREFLKIFIKLPSYLGPCNSFSSFREYKPEIERRKKEQEKKKRADQEKQMEKVKEDRREELMDTEGTMSYWYHHLISRLISCMSGFNIAHQSVQKW